MKSNGGFFFFPVGNSLVTLMCHLFNVYGLVHHFQLDMVKLHRFLGENTQKQQSPLPLADLSSVIQKSGP